MEASESNGNTGTFSDFPEEEPDPSKDLFDYASLRGGDYRDLTHEEAQRMRNAYQQKLLLDRRIRWLKSRALPDPEKDAAALLRSQELHVSRIHCLSLTFDKFNSSLPCFLTRAKAFCAQVYIAIEGAKKARFYLASRLLSVIMPGGLFGLVWFVRYCWWFSVSIACIWCLYQLARWPD